MTSGSVSVTRLPAPSTTATRAPVRRARARAMTPTAPGSMRRLGVTASSKAGIAPSTAVITLELASCRRRVSSGPSRASAATTNVTAPVSTIASRTRGRKPTPSRATSGLLEAVARAANGEDQLGVLGPLFELFSQVADVDVDRPRVAVGAVAPDRAQELLAIEQPSRLGHQPGQQLELREGEPHGLAANGHLAVAAIDLDRAHAEDLVPQGSGARAAKHGPDATAQFGEPERLGDVVVGAGLEALDGIRLAAQGGEHDYGHHVAPRAQRSANLVPVGSGAQRHVEQYDVELLGAGAVHRGAAIGQRGHLMALARKGTGEHLPQRGLVIDDADPECGRGCLHRPQATAYAAATVAMSAA